MKGTEEAEMTTDDFTVQLSGFPRSPAPEGLLREQERRPPISLADLRADLWDSDEEFDEFLAYLRACRQADLA
jgi:hypothetical protein